MNAPAVEVRDLVRDFPARPEIRRRGARAHGRPPAARTALDHVNLTVEAGSVHGLLGPNGAGKSTFAKILTTILVPTSGSVRVLGLDVERDMAAVRRVVALVLGGDRGLYGRLTARENLAFWAAAYGVRSDVDAAVTDVLRDVGLSDVHTQVQAFSRGMKQRVHLARALIARPRVLVLDEPTAGMDPAAAHAFRDLVRRVADGGATVLMTTHDMPEAEQVCDRVTLLDRGRVIFDDAPARLRRDLTTLRRVRVSGSDRTTVAAALQHHPDVAVRDAAGDVELTLERAADLADVLRALLGHGITAVAVLEPSLEDVYLDAVGDRGLHVG